MTDIRADFRETLQIFPMGCLNMSTYTLIRAKSHRLYLDDVL